MIRRIWSALQEAWYAPGLGLVTAFAVAVMVIAGVAT